MDKKEEAFPRGGKQLLTPLEKVIIEAQAKQDILFDEVRVVCWCGDSGTSEQRTSVIPLPIVIVHLSPPRRGRPLSERLHCTATQWWSHFVTDKSHSTACTVVLWWSQVAGGGHGDSDDEDGDGVEDGNREQLAIARKGKSATKPAKVARIDILNVKVRYLSFSCSRCDNWSIAESGSWDAVAWGFLWGFIQRGLHEDEGCSIYIFQCLHL